MNALRHSKRHHNIETETVVRLAVKLMRVRRILRSILCCNIIVVILCVKLSIVSKLKSIKIRESLSIALRIGQHSQSHRADQMCCNNYYN